MSDEEGAGFASSGESICDERSGHRFSPSSSPISISSARRSRSRTPPPTRTSPTYQGAPSPDFQPIPFLLDPLIIPGMCTWQRPLLRILRPLRKFMWLKFYLARPLTHDALLCGNLTEHYGFKAHCAESNSPCVRIVLHFVPSYVCVSTDNGFTHALPMV